MDLDLKDLLEQLQGDRSPYDIALEYAQLKDGQRPTRPDRYLNTVRGILNNPEGARFQNLARVFEVLGVDIRAAIAIAASQKIKEWKQ